MQFFFPRIWKNENKKIKMGLKDEKWILNFFSDFLGGFGAIWSSSLKTKFLTKNN